MRRRKSDVPTPALPRATPSELLRLLIPPAQAVDLVALGKTADAVANATRAFGKLRDDGLSHLTCDDIIVALAELDLRAKELAPELIQRLDETDAALAAAERALFAAKRERASARVQILAALGYRETTTEVSSTGSAIGLP